MIEITKENIHNKLSDIQSLRETKGKEDETLALLEKAISIAEEIEDYGLLSTLYWEESLVHQHIVMNEVAKDNSDHDVINVAKNNMAESANKAHEIIIEQSLDRKLPISHRFLGRVADYNEKYEDAIKHYKKALELLPETSESILELSAFLAHSMIRNGDEEEGLILSKKVYNDFFDSKLGNDLKNTDYYVWAVWMSGIPPRTLSALEDMDIDYDKDEMKQWLKETKNELENPTGNVSWGDDKFAFRIDELNKTLAYF